ncbi:MAG: metal ABC transporter substrate-binding protein [Syntrophorhabdales bacterium]
MKKTAFVLSCLLLLASAALFSCRPSEEPSGERSALQVVTTLFPLYDFARNVGGDKAVVTLLLPPGVEPHGFEPKPGDILRINKADIFVYTGDFMEPWATSVIKGAERRDLVVVDSSAGAMLRQETGDHGPSGEKTPATLRTGGRQEPVDPHIWLDLDNAQIMVDNIVAGFVRKDPRNRPFYEKNATAYKAKLRDLDERFRKDLSSCETRLFVHGGHYAFNYLARRYNLSYVSVYGFSPDAEPSPRHLAEIVHRVRQDRIRYVFYEELIQPRVAETIARETGARLLPLNGGHNVTKSEMESGVTFISLLENDLDNLRTGLQCR